MLHIITGKGGVGRSTVAASLAKRLADDGHGPVLLLEVQGSGRSLQLSGLEGPKPFENTPLPGLPDSWGARIMPKDAFRQYFSLLLSLGNRQSSFAVATSGLRERLVDFVIDNPVISAFVDVCPGLEPVVLLGKIYWEAASGTVPDSRLSWRHVVVDAPATGHGLMLFRSTSAVSEVFGSGPIHKQSEEVIEYMRDSALTRLYIVTTPEELPLRETLEMREALEKLRVRPYAFVVNRCAPQLQNDAPKFTVADADWAREAAFERETLHEQAELRQDLRHQLGLDAGGNNIKIIELPEIVSDQPQKIVTKLAEGLSS